MKTNYFKPKTNNWFLTMICIAFLLIQQFSFAQVSKINEIQLTFKKQDISLADVVQEIEQETTLRVYTNKDLNLKSPLLLPNRRIALKDLLEVLKTDQGIIYSLNNNLLSLKKQNTEKSNVLLAKGKVIDKQELTLPGAIVTNLNTKKSVSTDLEGHFEIEANTNDVLEFSYIGFDKIALKPSQNMIVQLQDSNSNLDEIVVIGYGTVKKKDLTGSVGQVNGELIEQRNTVQLSQALQGQLSGVSVTRNGSGAGSKATIKVRGITTIGNSDPLIVVDGVVRDDIDEVNSNDVQDITVLKDAAAASIYGSRAAAGVILITTKRAKNNEFNFTYKGDYGTEKATAIPQPVDYRRYMQMINEMSWNDAGNPTNGQHGIYSEEMINNWGSNNQKNPNLYPITNWQDILLKETASKERHSFTLSGGDKRINSRASIDYENIDALYAVENFKRIMTRINNSIKVNDYISGDLDVSYNSTKQESPNINPLWEAMRYAPIYAATWTDGRIAEGKSGSNAYANLYYGGSKKHFSDKIYGRVVLNITPIEDLKISFVLAPQMSFNRRKNFTKKLEYFDAEDPTRYAGLIAGNTNTSLVENRNESKQLTKQFIANYAKSLGKNDINLMLGYEDNYTSVESQGASASNMELSNFPYLDLAPIDYMINSGNKYETAYRSYFGRVIYSYADKYHFQGNIRRDGSSRFHKNYRWGVFPSFSVGWTISNEEFMQKQNVFSFLKLRGSWGTLGNERIGNYPYQSSIDFSSTLFYTDDQVVSKLTAAQVQYAIQNISWETTESIDFGADMYFLNNRLSLTVDYYKKKTKDMLLELEIPAFIGYANPQQNAGTMNTEGWDFDLAWRDQINDFKYSIGFNLSDSRTKMGNLNGRIVMNGSQIIREGSSYNAWYGYVSDGLYQSAEDVKNSPKLVDSVKPGDIKYKDISGPDGVPDGKISPDYDRVELGESLPRWFYGGNIQMEYKGIELALAFQGVAKQTSLLTEQQMRPFQSSWTSPMQEIDGQYWSPYNTEEQNMNAKFPRLSHVSAESNNYKMSDFWLINGAYFRIKNITLAYNFPQKLIKPLTLDKIRVYMSLNDFFTISNFPKGFDPESAYNTYVSKSIHFGASINF